MTRKIDQSQSRNVPAESSSTSSEPVEICAGCHQPLIRRGPKGECLRCLMAFAFPAEDEASPDAPSNEELAGKGALRYGHFEIETGADGHPVELGAGAMATTYQARDSVLHSAVALKVINQKVAEHPSARARFLREARAAAKLHHPNVASVTHYGEQNGECYYAMELVEGETLEARVRSAGPLPPALALEIGVQVARALAAAEACGVVHRDLKPSNIMLTTSQGEKTSGGAGSAATVVKVIDWGLAKAVSAESALGTDHTHGGFVGTPAFASPEQFSREENRRVDHRSDIYSLGVTLWYLLCGRTPFTGTTLEEIRVRQIEQPMPLAQLTVARVPARIVALLKSMMAVDPAERPQSARELLDTLRACQRYFPSADTPRPARFGRDRRFALILSLLLVAVAFTVGTYWQHSKSAPAPSEASVAVLPFENSSRDPAEAFFGASIQGEIAANLARISRLKVIGPDSVKGYPPGKRNLPAIGEALGVNHLIEGSVQRDGERIHLHVVLMDARTAKPVWTKDFDRSRAETFALESAVAAEVADRLHVTPSAAETIAIARAPTRSLPAYDLYLRTREGTNMAPLPPEQRQLLQHKIDLLNEALKLDPGFVPRLLLAGRCTPGICAPHARRDAGGARGRSPRPGRGRPAASAASAAGCRGSASCHRPSILSIHCATANRRGSSWTSHGKPCQTISWSRDARA